jgi:hypothetical protein
MVTKRLITELYKMAEFDLSGIEPTLAPQNTTARKFAEALMAQNQPAQGQMISGHYVKPSFFQALQPAINMITGAYLSNKADEQSKQYADAIRQLGAKETSDILTLANGRPASQQELAGPAYQGVAPSVQYPALEGDTKAALAKALTGQTPQAKALVAPLLQNALPKKTDKLIEYETYKAETPKDKILPFSQWVNRITPAEEERLKLDRQRLGLEGEKLGLEKEKLALEMGGGKLTDTQGNATAFGVRMKESNQLLNDLEKKGITNTGIVRSTIAGTAGMTPFIGEKLQQGVHAGMNVLPSALGGPSAEQQQVDAARRNFVTAVLRKESGAAISPSEFYNESQKYFPQPGDSDAVIAQKRHARDTAIKAMEIQAGPGKRFIEETNLPTDNGGWRIK